MKALTILLGVLSLSATTTAADAKLSERIFVGDFAGESSKTDAVSAASVYLSAHLDRTPNVFRCVTDRETAQYEINA